MRIQKVAGVWLLRSALSLWAANQNPFTMISDPSLVGRWDLNVHDGNQTYPSWIEVKLSGYRTLVGSYVGQFGSARPVAKIDFDQGTGHFRFVVPPQWEHRTNDVAVEATVQGDMLKGETTNEQGKPVQLEGHRAPLLVRGPEPNWGKPLALFNGTDLSGWKPRHPNTPNGWQVENKSLVNAKPGNDLITEGRFTDFKLRARFRYPAGSNSGIYLRGRYEVQIEDNYGLEPESHLIGGIYGFLTPRVNTAKKAGEWQTLEITLVGRIVTVVLNGEPIIERQAIPGITGGALDSDEARPGPIIIQGDHGKVEFAELVLTPGE
ncbi:MAG TPA: DUF1080 domain-containing protein [Verrucomicrobiae bacterium]|jgi:hypothetical protein|nr:DUF1080 domain-containing protein [Verrucomicrobiae bacterium]